MNVTIAQLSFRIGNVPANFERLRETVARCREGGTDLLVFPELALCGYPLRDLARERGLYEESRRRLETLAAEAGGMAVVLGGPAWSGPETGGRMRSSAAVLLDGSGLLPDGENPPVQDRLSFPRNGFRIEVTTGATKAPPARRPGDGPLVIVHLCSTPFTTASANARPDAIRKRAASSGAFLLSVNQVGGRDGLLFEGHSLACAPSGGILAELDSFAEDVRSFDLADTERNQPPRETSFQSLVHDALVMGIRDYCRECGAGRALVGLSGGLDSAVVAVLACRALGPENVTGVAMPSACNPGSSLEDAAQLAAALGIPLETVPIGHLVEEYRRDIGQSTGRPVEGLAEENLQARIRGTVLMTLSNSGRGLVLNTGNKSECAMGYCTLYGDMCGGLGVIGDLYKTQVYELARWINRDGELIPGRILTKAPSAELRPGQTDQDELPPYPVLDRILAHKLEDGLSAGQIVGRGFEAATVHKALRLLRISEYKRKQAPPSLRLSDTAFGVDRDVPINHDFVE